MKKLNSDFVYLEDMYNDDYYPRFLVDKVKAVSYTHLTLPTTSRV